MPLSRNSEEEDDRIIIQGGTDNASIGNVGDALKTASTPALGIQLDAFGRQRTSESRNIFEWQFRYDPSFNEYWDTTTANGGAHATDGDKATRYMTIATSSGSEAVMQSRRRIEYIPGKSQDAMFTFNFLGLQSDSQKGIGLYDVNNGLFLQANGTTLSLVIRSSISGSTVDNVVSQSSWSEDKLDGTGASGLTLDMNNQQLMRITYAYLGIGDVCISFFINGSWRIAHIFRSANVLTGSYMQSGILPIRAEIKAIGIPAAVRRLEFSCVSVASEGKATEVGRIRNGNTGTSAISFNASEDFIFAIRIKDIYPYSSVRGLTFTLLPASGSNDAIYRIYYNPNLTSPTWSDNASSITQSVTNTPSFSGGLVIDAGHINLTGKKQRDSEQRILTSDIFLGFDLAGVSDILMLTLETTDGGGSCYFSGSWREIF